MSSISQCSVCLRTDQSARAKALAKPLECQECHVPLCKDCAQFLDSETFSFRGKLASELAHTYYCPNCYEAHIVPALEEYQNHMEQAKGVYFFFNTQKRKPPMIKKSKEKIEVKACVDRDETIMRMAFRAIELGFNAVVEADVRCEKLRNEGYQKSVWKAVGFPAEVDSIKMDRL